MAAIVTPMQMLDKAVSNGAAIEVLERLMALQERYEANQGRKAFDAAVAAAKTEIPVVSKNKTVDFTSQKGRTNYVYEDLGEIARTVDPILAKHGLSYRYRSSQEGGRLSVTCIISHRDGHSEETSLTATNDDSGNKNSIQAIGSAATYLQRYTLKLALGLAAAKDDDAKAVTTGGAISKEQADEIFALAEEVKADKISFCKIFKAASIPEIQKSDYGRAIKLLKAKGEKNASGH